jgi:hypothetical protein
VPAEIYVEGQTDIKKLKVIFGNLATASKNASLRLRTHFSPFHTVNVKHARDIREDKFQVSCRQVAISFVNQTSIILVRDTYRGVWEMAVKPLQRHDTAKSGIHQRFGKNYCPHFPTAKIHESAVFLSYPEDSAINFPRKFTTNYQTTRRCRSKYHK